MRGVDAVAEAGVDKADVVAAVTGDDEDNLVVSLLAKQEFGVPRVVARVNNPKNEWMFNEMLGRRRRRVDAAPAHRVWWRRRCPSARSCACCRSRAARPGSPR